MHCALNRLHKLPHEILDCPREERAFIFGSVELKAEAERKLAEKDKNKGSKRGRKRRLRK